MYLRGRGGGALLDADFVLFSSVGSYVRSSFKFVRGLIKFIVPYKYAFFELIDSMFLVLSMLLSST